MLSVVRLSDSQLHYWLLLSALPYWPNKRGDR